MSDFSIQVTAKIAMHEGGSKFYETLLFRHNKVSASGGGMRDPGSVLIKHYGPAAKYRGGGQSKIETGDDRSMVAENVKIWKQKGKRGEYTQGMPAAAEAFGFYDPATFDTCTGAWHSSEFSTTKQEITSAYSLASFMTDHFIDRATQLTILSKLSIHDGGYDPNEEHVHTEIVDDSPPPPRDHTWGSW